MSQVVPDALEVEVLTELFADAMTMRIFGNNTTPVGTSVTGDFTEIAGGGYAAKALLPGDWSIVSGDPSYSVYSSTQTWTFTGPINAPGTIYGYYVTRDSDNKLMWAERFSSGIVPFSPIGGSVIKVLPKFTAQSAF